MKSKIKIQLGRKYFILYKSIVTPVLLEKVIDDNKIVVVNLITNRKMKLIIQKIKSSDEDFKWKYNRYCLIHKTTYPGKQIICDLCYIEALDRRKDRIYIGNRYNNFINNNKYN